MTGCEWRETPDGLRYLFVDYRDAGPDERFRILQESVEAMKDLPDARSLVRVGGTEFDPSWFKSVKDASVAARPDRRIAVLVDGKTQAQRTRGLNFLTGAETTLPFDSEDDAIAWLRET